MEERKITITLEKAREWYNSNNVSLKEIALQAFNEKELISKFKDITTFKDACNVLNIDHKTANYLIRCMCEISKASAAMFKLNIIRKALNLGHDLRLTKNPKDFYIYYPFNPFVTKSSTYYKSDINSGKMEIIGKIKIEGEEYNVLGGSANIGITYIGFLGCANKEIAQHFGKYFGMLITKAKYGDIIDFEIIDNKYNI